MNQIIMVHQVTTWIFLKKIMKLRISTWQTIDHNVIQGGHAQESTRMRNKIYKWKTMNP